MLRTSYSQILNSSRDFSIAICDARGRLVAQADHIPVHVGAMPWATRAVAERLRDVQPGDVILLNDPYHGGSHLPDLTVFVPVFDQGKRLFWSIVRAHQSDIGGATHGGYNPAATEIWQEGLRIPPIRLYEAGGLREDLLDMLALNIRNPRDFRGDLAAMIGAAQLGEQRLTTLLTEFDAATVDPRHRRHSRCLRSACPAIVATWKDGTFHGEALLDDDGHGRDDIGIAAKVTKRGSDIEVDLSGSDPQTTGFVNSSHANMQAAVAMAFAYLIDPDVPKNDGAFRPLKVIAKQGTIVWADAGPPVTLCTSHCSNEIVEAIIKALAASCPDRTMGGWGRRFRIAIQGEDPRHGPRLRLAHVPCAPGRRRIRRRRRLVVDRRMAHASAASSSAASRSPRYASPCSSAVTNSAPTSAATASIAAASASISILWSKPASRRGPTPPATASRHGAGGMLGGDDGLPHDYRLVSQDQRRARPEDQGGRHRHRAGRRAAGPFGRRRRLGRSGQAQHGGAQTRSRARPRHRRAECARWPNIMIGIDVGGTFTDLVVDRRERDDLVRQVAIHPAGPVDRRARRPRRTGAQT